MADDTAPQQDPTPTPTPPASPTAGIFQTAPPVTGDDDAGKGGKEAILADLARERKERQRLAQELETTRLSSLSDAEKAVELARAETRKETLRLVGGRLVDAEVRAASAGRLAPEQVEALLEGLDRSRFITDDGDVNREALTTWVGRFAPSPLPGPPRFGDADQGVRTTSPPAGRDERQTARALFGNT